MEKIKSNCIVPSAAFSVTRSHIKFYDHSNTKIPSAGDLIFGEITELGHHRNIESKSARMHTLNKGTRSIFVFGNRYSPHQYEGLVPTEYEEIVDLYSIGGVVGLVENQSQLIGVATKVKVLGYVCSATGTVVNTKNYVLVNPKKLNREKEGSKVILCVGTSMNSGKTYAAAACCYAISAAGISVRGAKITGTAAQKDILLMNDCGADRIADFTYFGYPSTYRIKIEKIYEMFHAVDMKYGNNPKNYLVIEFADGIFQQETSQLLKMQAIRSRIHKLIFCAPDAIAVYGGIHALKEEFDLVPDAISGICSSSPLAIREIKSFTNIPVLQSMEKNHKNILQILDPSTAVSKLH